MIRSIVLALAFASASSSLAQQVNTTCQQIGNTTYCNGQTQQPPDLSGFQRLGEVLGTAIRQRQQASKEAAQQETQVSAVAVQHAEDEYRREQSADIEERALRQVAAARAPYQECLLAQAKNYAAPGVQPSDSIAAARGKCVDLRKPIEDNVAEVFRFAISSGPPLNEREIAQETELSMRDFDAKMVDAMTAVVLDELAKHKKRS